MISVHGRSMMRAVLVGIAGAVPRSVVPNLVEMLSTLLVRCAEESKVYLREILFDVGHLILAYKPHNLIPFTGELHTDEGYARSQGEIHQDSPWVSVHDRFFQWLN